MGCNPESDDFFFPNNLICISIIRFTHIHIHKYLRIDEIEISIRNPKYDIWTELGILFP